MTDFHPYNPRHCVTCQLAGREPSNCDGVRASDIDLLRVVPDATLDLVTQHLGVTYESGSTLADIIRDGAGIGYGGHFDETDDDEDDVLGVVALDDRELNGMHAARLECMDLLRAAIGAVEWPS